MFAVNLFCTLIISLLILFLYGKKELQIKLSNRYYWIIFCFAFLFGLFLRIYQFGQLPAGINQDEAMAAVESKSLLMHGTDRFGMKYPIYLTAWIFSQMNVLLSYIMIPFIKFFGLNIFAVRLPNLLLSIAGILFLFSLIRDMFGKIQALIIFCFCSINPWHIMQSRWALEANLLPHIFIIALFFLYRGLKKSNKTFVYLSMFFFAMCMYCYGIAFYTVNLFLLASAIYFYRKKILQYKQIIFCILIYLFFSWPIYAVIFINAFKINTIETPWFTIPYFSEQIRTKDILFFSDNPILQSKENSISLLKFLFQICLSNTSAINDFGAVCICSIPLLFLGIIFSFKKLFTEKEIFYRIKYFFVLTNFFIGIFAIFITPHVDSCLNRANFIFYPMIILIGLGIYYLICIWRKAVFILFAVYYIMTATFCNSYFGVYKNYIKEEFYCDFINLLESIKENNYDKIFITANLQFRNSFYVSEILTLFCHDIDTEYFQGKIKVDGKTYNEKYIYKDFLDEIPVPQKNAAYVICDFELQKQYLKKFRIKKFNRCYILESK